MNVFDLRGRGGRRGTISQGFVAPARLDMDNGLAASYVLGVRALALRATLLALLLTGCSGWLEVVRVASTQKRPCDVWVFEDSDLLAPSTTRQTALNPDRAAVWHTLLLVDAAVGDASQADRSSSSGLAGTQKVAVFVFDGGHQVTIEVDAKLPDFTLDADGLGPPRGRPPRSAAPVLIGPPALEP